MRQALDTRLTDERRVEGFVRVVVSKVQSMRKEAGFQVTDHIRLTYAAGEKAADILSHHADAVGKDTLADRVEAAAPSGFVREWNINGEKMTLGVEVVG